MTDPDEIHAPAEPEQIDSGGIHTPTRSTEYLDQRIGALHDKVDMLITATAQNNANTTETLKGVQWIATNFQNLLTMAQSMGVGGMMKAKMGLGKGKGKSE